MALSVELSAGEVLALIASDGSRTTLQRHHLAHGPTRMFTTDGESTIDVLIFGGNLQQP